MSHGKLTRLARYFGSRIAFFNCDAAFHAFYVMFVPTVQTARLGPRLRANDEQYVLILRADKNVLFYCVKIYDPVIDTPTQ